MTAEIAVINRFAVMLAADSAVTIGSGGSAKIYQSADKLFELSGEHPVAVMIYDSASISGIPWELVIKDFRMKKGRLAAKRLFTWKDRFINFLSANYAPSPDVQEQIFLGKIEQVLLILFADFSKHVAGLFSEQLEEAATDERVEQINAYLIELINKFVTKRLGNDRVDTFDEEFAGVVVSGLDTKIREMENEVFNDYPFRDEHRRALDKLYQEIILTKSSVGNRTGVVISGYGTDDMFPSLCHFVIDDFYKGKLKCYVVEEYDVDRNDKSGTVFAFAQPDVAEQFMYGIDPVVEASLVNYFERSFSALRDVIKDRVVGLADDQLEKIDFYFGDFFDFAKDRYFDQQKPVMNSEYFSSMEGIVRSMPKQEMAHLAESLVNITTLKRRVSAQRETVGGPIDVAAISKHDGFVWIKRKHYFPAEINPRYYDRNFGQQKAVRRTNTKKGV